MGVCLGVRFAVMDKAVRMSSPCVRGALCGPISSYSSLAYNLKGQGKYAERMSKGEASCAVGPGRDGAGGGNALFGKPLQPLLCVVKSVIGVEAEASGRVHLGKIG
jgi:hypothetical protein